MNSVLQLNSLMLIELMNDKEIEIKENYSGYLQSHLFELHDRSKLINSYKDIILDIEKMRL